MTSYLMESPEEGERLEHKTDDAETERQLALVGLEPGMTALDAGCGTGAVARVMARLVGSEGSVWAVDASSDRVEQGRHLAARAGIQNLEFLQADLDDGPMKRQGVDFVWSRFLFEYLENPDQVLANLVQSTRVGGKVVVGDLDGNGVFHDPMGSELEAGLTRLTRALEGRFDPFAGRKLFRRFRKQPLESIRVHLLPYHAYAGAAPERDMANWVAKFQTLAPIGRSAFGGQREYDRWVNRYLDHLRDPDTFTYSTLVLVEGRRAR